MLSSNTSGMNEMNNLLYFLANFFLKTVLFSSTKTIMELFKIKENVSQYCKQIKKYFS